MNVLFRCDASEELGLGHISRCITLARRLQNENGCNIFFAIKKNNIATKILKNVFSYYEFDESDDKYESWLISLLVNLKINRFILDVRNDINKDFVIKIKRNLKLKVFTIDDPEEKRISTDVAIYPPVPQLQNMNWSNYKGKLKIGWEYVIVKNDFLQLYPKKNNLKTTILVSMGGTDPLNMIYFILSSLINAHKDFKLLIILGPGYKRTISLKKLLNKSKLDFELYNNPSNFSNIASSVDFAIISFGQTAYELLALNIPSLYVCLTADHHKSSEIFSFNSFGISTGIYSNQNESKFIKNFNKIFEDFKEMRQSIIDSKVSEKFRSKSLINLFT